MMYRLLTSLCLFWLTAAAWAQEPIVRVEMDQTDAVPGQYLTLRMSVLVPTWMPKPVEFPSLEQPNLRVLLPERATSPISETVDGESWSGVSRRYRVSPMVPGEFVIPPQDVTVTYSDPDGTDPVVASVPTPQIRLRGVLPEGAEELDPFIAATGLRLTQDVSEKTIGLKPGESVTRRITAAIEGASPIMLPSLLPSVEITGIGSYPAEPQVTEAEDRGVLSGTRVESVTLMAESGGSGVIPGVELRWYNLGTGTVKTAFVDGFEVSVAAPAASPSSFDARNLILIAVIAFAAALILLAVYKLWPRTARWFRSRRDTLRASKDFARGELLKAIGRQDYPAAMRLLDEWARRPPQTGPEQMERITAATTRIGARLYGTTPQPLSREEWKAFANAVQHGGEKKPSKAGIELPSLNPVKAA